MSRLARSTAAAMLALLSIAPTLLAQRGAPVRRIISIGNHPRVDGVRINFRDRELELVRGANITVWTPKKGYVGGEVKGLALGLPATMAGDITGFGVSVFGVGAEENFRGIGLAGVGLGAGGSTRGIMLGGIGVGAGSDVRGIAVGGIGVGAGGDARGLMVGGIGAAAGGSVRGITVGGIGAGAGGNVRGMMVGGIGAGAGGDARGIIAGGIGAGAGGSIRGLSVGGIGVGAGSGIRGVSVAGVGVGSGGDITGLSVAGVGVGSGGTLRWVSVGGLGVGAPRIDGFAAGLMVGAERTRALVIAPAHFRTAVGGQMNGVAVSSVNYIPGYQRGLTIGLVNYTERLRGVQLGVVNIVAERPWPFKALPIVNFGQDR
jgi:hypothetical protein